MILSFVLAAGGWSAEPAAKAKPDKIIASNYTTLQEAIDAARALKVYHIYVPSGVYFIDKTLNFTGLSYAPIKVTKPEGGEEMVPRNETMIFEGAGRTTVLVARTGNTPAMDLSGAQPMMTMRDFVLQTTYGPNGWEQGASVGIYMARTANAASSGNHIFENITVGGAFKVAAVYAWDSEENRYYNCNFYNHTGDAFICSDHNSQEMKSPYVENGQSSNAEHRFYGTRFLARGEGSVALRLNGGQELSINGGFISLDDGAFAGIYLDGGRLVKSVTLCDIRIEGFGKHGLYATGGVEGVLIEGGEWLTTGEAILCEDKPTGDNPAHRYVFSRDYAGRPQNWIIQGLGCLISFSKKPGRETKPGEFCAMRFESLLDSRIENINVIAQYLVEEGGKTKTVLATDVPLVVIEKYSRRNVLRVPSREAVLLEGDAQNNQIVATADGTGETVPALWTSGMSSWMKNESEMYTPRNYDGTNRTYIKPDNGTSLLNLGMMDVRKINHPKAGDIAVHDGSGTASAKPSFVMFDGNDWVCLTPGEKLKKE